MIEYYATDTFGNTIYIDLESNILYRFTPEDRVEANDYQDLSLLPLDEEHKVNKEDIYY